MKLPCIVGLALLSSFCEGEFSERLEIHTISGGTLAAHFTFKQSFDLDRDADFGSFPRPIVELQRAFGIKRLRVAMRRGRWHYREWGMPLMAPSSIGAEVEVLLIPGDDAKEDIRYRWKRLCSTLSGLFCASLNLINERNSISPQWDETERAYRLHGQLTTEAVCTENLTPWTKLLPCAAVAGLASLLNPLRIFASGFHQFDVRINVQGNHLILQQELLMANKLAWFGENGFLDWTLEKIFDQTVRQLCPVSVNDVALIVHPPHSNAEGWKLIKVNDDGGHIDYLDHQVSQRDILNLNIGAVGATLLTGGTVPALLEVDRSLTGVGQEWSGLALVWRNKDTKRRLHVSHRELIPDFLHLFLSQAELQGNSDENLSLSTLQKFLITPAGSRSHPTELDIEFTLEPSSVLLLHIPLEKDFLRYTDFPFDANRGFDLAGAIINFNFPDDPDSLDAGSMVTEKLLITMATPDFTMPYNVITLTSTVIVLFYGTLFNVCYRRFYLRSARWQRLRERFIERFKGLWVRLVAIHNYSSPSSSNPTS